MIIKLTKEQQDVLKEIVSIGAGNAATALSQMLSKKVSILVPKVNLRPIEEASLVFGDSETLVTAVYLQLLGDVQGVILLSFKQEDQNRLADVLLGRELGKTIILDEMGQSAVKETATILSGAYLNAIAKFLKLRLLVSSPGLTHDMAGAVIDNILIETSREADFTLIIDTQFDIIDISTKVMTYFFFIPNMESLEKIIKIVGVNTNRNGVK